MSLILKIFLFFLISTSTFAENLKNQIVYINMEKLFNESIVGISFNEEISKLSKSNQEKIKNLEEEIKTEDNNINSKRNILSEEELKNKISDLNEKIKRYQAILKKNQDDINKKKIDGSNIILNNLKPILSEYSKKNSISMVLQKQNVVIGKKELDITEDIIKILNEKIKKIDIN
tara:strand:- start:3 stop:527 length:525 start_codon:yes stop_codon:yes gene_type:complete